MNNPDRTSADRDRDLEADRPTGPNLKLIYSLIVFAMLAAIGLAALIVLPFYHRR